MIPTMIGGSNAFRWCRMMGMQTAATRVTTMDGCRKGVWPRSFIEWEHFLLSLSECSSNCCARLRPLDAARRRCGENCRPVWKSLSMLLPECFSVPGYIYTRTRIHCGRLRSCVL